MGPPPADEVAARDAIEEAVAGLAPDSGRPAAEVVERGEVLDRAEADGTAPPPHPIAASQSVTMVVTDLVFVREDEAIMTYEVRLSGGGRFPMNGRAVLVDGRWLVSYDTVANMQRMGGQLAPSLLDHPEGDTGPAAGTAGS